VGILLVNTINANYISIDGAEYHNLAVNVLKGNGYSFDTEAPYTPTFYREPGYVLTLLIPLGIYSVFDDVDYVSSEDVWAGESIHNISIAFIKYFQVLVFGLICVLNMKALRYVVGIKKAFICSIALALFLPMTVHSTSVLREMVQTFYLVLTNLFLVLYYFKKKLLYIILAGVSLGMAVLTLQVMVYLLLFVLLFLIYTHRMVFSKIIREFALLLVVFLVILSPWLLRTLSYYPDLRTLKSLGTNLTYEKMNYLNAHRRMHRLDLITYEELLAIEIDLYDNGLEGFKRSYNSYYANKVDSLKLIISNYQTTSERRTEFIYRTIDRYVDHIFKSLDFSGFLQHPRFYIVRLVLSLLSVVIGFLYIFGLVKYLPKMLPYATVFIFMFFSLVFLSSRRVMPIYPFFVAFTILGLIQLLNWGKSRFLK